MNEERPQPVMNAAWVAGSLITLVKLLLALFASFGWIDINDTQELLIVGIVTIIVDFGIVLATLYVTKDKVTPVESPRIETADGQLIRLVREDTGQPVAGDRL